MRVPRKVKSKSLGSAGHEGQKPSNTLRWKY